MDGLAIEPYLDAEAVVARGGSEHLDDFYIVAGIGIRARQQIADHVIIINRGKMVRSGRLRDLLAAGRQVEILADRVPEDLPWLRTATVEPAPRGVRILVDVAGKREAVESLWAAGCDVIAMTPLRSTLEELFLKEVDQPGGAQ